MTAVGSLAPAAPAYRAAGEPVSRERFYALACDPARPVVVEACAGAGKTWMLVSRIVRALLDGALPHEILAITFTRKAAGEMRTRLDEWLREFAAPNTSHEARVQALVARGVTASQAVEFAPRLAGLHEQMLASGRAVEVRTFHGWFSQLLRAAPIELLAGLGLQSDVELIEELADHRAEVFRCFHRAVLADPGLRADHALLIAERGRSQSRKWFEALWSRRVEFELADAAGVLEASVPAADALWPELQGLSHPAARLQSSAWKARWADLARALGSGGAKAQQAATGLIDALALTDPQAFFDAARAALFTNDGAPRKQLGNLQQLDDATQSLSLVADQIEQQRAHREHLRLVRLSRLLVLEYAGYKRSRGLADMSDLERCGLSLLRDSALAGWVQERLDARVRHLLIDEFQDTSPLQWHALLAWLSAYAGAGGGQLAPAVFIVGDPKQSIYRFRRAEPRVFSAAGDFVVGALGGVMLSCDHTRRNAPEVLEVINAVFGQADAAGEFDGFRPHTTELSAVPGAGLAMLPRVPRPARVGRAATAPVPVWRDSLSTPRHEPEELLREQEAAWVAAAIADLVLTQGVAPAEIFVLSRKRQSLRLVAAALRSLTIPFAAAEDFELMAAPEARDLVALLDVLASQRHRLSLAHALRSPLFGASDDDLVALAGRAAGGDWWHALTSQAWDRPALQRAREWMPRWHAAAAQLPPHDLLDRIVAEGELHRRLAATVPPEQRLTACHAVDAVLEQALTLEGGRYATPYSFVRALKRKLIKVAAPAHSDAVQLLTVHGAKGLEAKVVFVLDADPQPQGVETATLLVDWPVDAERPRRCAFVYSEALCPPSLRDMLAAEVAARRREELNGLYVALTRARERLVVSATAPSRPGPGASWWERLEPLGAAWSPGPPGEQSTASGAAGIPDARVQVLPEWQGQIEAAPPADDTAATRLGQAVHRTLEWATSGAADEGVGLSIDELAAAAAEEFVAPAEAVARFARAILSSPACAPFFDPAGRVWAGNEVQVAYGGESLRIDRLVARTGPDGPVWWVLDYKINPAPQLLPENRLQLLRYRDAVRRLEPGASVRCAFISGDGKLIEIEG